jgi:hypothetical protein
MLIACSNCAMTPCVEPPMLGAATRCAFCGSAWLAPSEPAEEEFAAPRAGEDFAADLEWVGPAAGIADPIAAKEPGATQDGPPVNEAAAERDRLRKLAGILETAPEPAPDFPLPDPAIPAAEAASSALDIVPEPLGLPDMAALDSAPEPFSEESALDVVPQRTAVITTAAPAITPPAARIAQQPQKPSRRRDFASFGPRRQRLAAPRQPWRLPRPGLPAAILILAAAMTALLAGRSEIVRHAPQTASLYAAIGMPVNLRRLDFDGVKTARESHDGIPVLVVEGNIVSHAANPVDVPQLHFAIRNPDGLEIYRWTASPDRPMLAPGEQMAFRSRLAAPPAESSEVMVRFLGHNDEVAGLQ